MRVFLDTRDLIGFLEGRGPCDLATLRERLNGGGHQLVLTWTVVLELAAPLITPAATTVVTRSLNDLETLPLAYIANGQIIPKEIGSAIRARVEGREYSPINPYVERLDEAIPVSDPAPTASYINHSLAETVFTIWQVAPEVFRWQRDQINRLKSTLDQDRSIADPPKCPEHFRAVIRKHLKLYRIPEPSFGADDLFDWIYQCPSRCPGIRLGYEVYHHLRRNLGDHVEASDFGDLAHINCLPYVDVLTLDRRPESYSWFSRGPFGTSTEHKKERVTEKSAGRQESAEQGAPADADKPRR